MAVGPIAGEVERAAGRDDPPLRVDPDRAGGLAVLKAGGYLAVVAKGVVERAVWPVASQREAGLMAPGPSAASKDDPVFAIDRQRLTAVVPQYVRGHPPVLGERGVEAPIGQVAGH